jgi:site-specific DNA-methyltransferase (adenine-specific)
VKPYYEDEQATIFHVDCRSVDLEGTAACVVTSPPYNVGIVYGEHDDLMPWDAYRALAVDACATISRALLPVGGRAWVNVTPVVPVTPIPAGDHSGRGTNPRVSLLGIWTDALERADLGIWDYVAWPTPRGPGCAWGSWQSPAGPNMRGEWETIIAAHRGPWSRSTPEAWKGWKDDGNWMPLTTNVWNLASVNRTENGHPAAFPEALAARAIRLSSWPGETVFDPFMGAGATLRAAKDLGRKAIGCDVDERYCELAALKLAQGVLEFG